MLWLTLCAAGFAQDIPGQASYTAPPLTGELYRPSPWSDVGFSTVGATLPDRTVAAAELTWLHAPVRWESGGETTRLLADAMGSNLSVAGGNGRLAAGAVMPIWWVATGDLSEGSPVLLGDPSLDLAVAALPGGEDAVGLALLARVGTSLGAESRMLSRAGPFWELGLSADLDEGPLQLGADLGTRGVPQTVARGVTIDDQFWFRTRAAWQPTEGRGLSAEVHGQLQYRDLTAATTSAELMLGGHGRVTPRTGLHAGVGAPLSGGIGVPKWRVLVGVSYAGAAEE